jgi:tetratricopeptide (TPR) repeat protein
MVKILFKNVAISLIFFLFLSSYAFSSSQNVINRAQELYSEGNYEEVISLVDNFVSANQKSEYLPYVLYARGLSYYKIKQYPKAINDFKVIIDKYSYLDVLCSEAMMALAECYKKQKAYNLAIVIYEQIEKKYPDKKNEAEVQKAWAYHLSGKTDNATQTLNKLISSSEKLDSLEKIYILGSMYKDKKDYKKAVETFKKIPKDSILANDVYYQIGDVAMAVKRYDKAVEFLRNVESKGAYFNDQSNLKELAWYKMAIAYYNINKFYESRIVCEDFLKTFPSSPFGKDIKELILLTYLRQQKIKPLLKFYDSINTENNDGSSFDVETLIGNYFFEKEQYDQAVLFYNKLVNLEDGDYTSKNLFHLANSYFYLEDYQKASELYKIFLRKFSNDLDAPQAAFRLAYIFSWQGNYESSLKLYRTIQQHFPNLDYIDLVTYNIGWCYYKLDQNEKALLEYERFVGKFPDSQLLPTVLYEIGNVYYMQGLYSQAADYYYQVMERYAESEVASDASYRLGRSYYYAGDFQGALKRWQELAQKHKGTPIARAAEYEIAQAYFEEEDLESAFRATEDFMGSYPNDELTFSLLERIQEYFIFSEQYDLGIEYFERISKFYTDNEMLDQNIMAILGRLYLMNNNVSEAIKIVNSLKNRTREFESFQMSASALYNIISIMLANNDFPQATSLLEKMKNQTSDKEFQEVYLLVEGEILLNTKDYQKAEECFKKLLHDYPDSPYLLYAYFNLAKSYINNQETDKAVKIYKKLISSYNDERSLQAYFKLSEIYYNDANYNDALVCCQHIIVFFPQSKIWAPKAYYLAALSQQQLGNREKAANLLKRMIEIYPQSAEILKAQELLKEVK